jgi:multiple antibiotic resistance protein
LLSYFLLTLSALVVIVNPVTKAFVFIPLTQGATASEQADIAKRACLVSLAVLITFGLAGQFLFKLFGITIGSFRIAGGVILFQIAMNMVRHGVQPHNENASDQSDTRKALGNDDVSIIPLAIPFIAGPGSIATMMILMSEAPSIYHGALVLLSAVVAIFLTKLALDYSHFIVAFVGDYGMVVVTKLFGLLLSVIAVEFILGGIKDVLPGIMAVLDTVG